MCYIILNLLFIVVKLLLVVVLSCVCVFVCLVISVCSHLSLGCETKVYFTHDVPGLSVVDKPVTEIPRKQITRQSIRRGNVLTQTVDKLKPCFHVKIKLF